MENLGGVHRKLPHLFSTKVLEKQQEAFAQQHKFSKAKSASPRCEETENQETRGTPPHLARRQQATDAPRGGQWTPHPQEQRLPNNTLWRSSNTQRPQDAPHIIDPQEACRKCGGNGHWARGCYSPGYAARWVSGASIASNDREMASDHSRREASGDRTTLPLQTNGQANQGGAALSAAVMIGGNSYKATIDSGATASFVSEEMAGNIAALGRITRTRRQVRLANGRCGGTIAERSSLGSVQQSDRLGSFLALELTVSSI